MSNKRPFRRLSFPGAKIRIILRKIEGSFKDPLSFLTIIGLFLLISLFCFPFLNNIFTKEYFSPIVSEQVFSLTPFLDSTSQPLIESPDFLLVEQNSLKAVAPPVLVSPKVFGTLSGQSELMLEDEKEEEKGKEIQEYIVEEGDTLSNLATKFEISLNTILWANDLTGKSTIRPGQKLIILPVSGVIYHVKSGDTLSKIAQNYKADLKKIVDFNELSEEGDIHIGDILIIPNGAMPSQAVKSSSVSPTPNNVGIPVVPSASLVNSQFILPVSSPYLITQGLHWYNAVDFSQPGYACGRPVFAAAGGIIQEIGYNNTYGNYIRILHPNGVVTLYAHLSAVKVKNNDSVNVGNIIGYIGNTGRTRGVSGCHLHFEVRGAQNPFAK